LTEEIKSAPTWPTSSTAMSFNPNPLEGDLSENPGYSSLLVQQYRIDALRNPLLAESLAGVFSESPEMVIPDYNFDRFSMESAVESGTGGDAKFECDNNHVPSYQPPPKLPIPSSIPPANEGKQHPCIQCGKWFDRWTRSRDCAYKDLDQTPHQCGGRCGVAMWCVIYIQL
jgi:hypothetical protein